MNPKFSISILLKCQHFVYTSHCFLLLFVAGMDVAVDGGLNVRVSYILVFTKSGEKQK